MPHHIAYGEIAYYKPSLRWDYMNYLKLMAYWCSHCWKVESGLLRDDELCSFNCCAAIKRGAASEIGEAHRRYTLDVNSREGWGAFLAGAILSFPMDEAHLYAAKL